MAGTSELKWNRAKDLILEGIKSGLYRPGQRLPSEHTLADSLAMNHRTIRRGLQELVKQGVIIKRPKVGNFIREPQARELLTQVAIFLPYYMKETSAHSPGQEFTHHPALAKICNGAARAFDQDKFSVTTLFYRDEYFQMDVVQVALSRGIQGIMLLPTDEIPAKDIEYLFENGVKVVLLMDAPNLSSLGLVWVNIDTGMALAQTLNRLYDLGHRNIQVGLYTHSPARNERIKVIDIFCRQNGLGVAKNAILDISNVHSTIDYHALLRIFDLQPQPTALIVPDEFIACEIFRQCYQRHIRVPDDLSIAALVDNTPHLHPVPLSAPNSFSLGIQATEMAGRYLIQLMAGEQPPEREIHLRCDMQWKASVGRVPARHD